MLTYAAENIVLRSEKTLISEVDISSLDPLPELLSETTICSLEDACTDVHSAENVDHQTAGAEIMPIRFAENAGDMKASFQPQITTHSIKNTLAPEYSAYETIPDPTIFLSQGSTEVIYESRRR